jgi:hypothetical protein
MKLFYFAVLPLLLAPFSTRSNPAITVVPFQLKNGLIIVKAKINGKEGNFILDTGATDITLNERYFNGKANGQHFFGINGSVSQSEIELIHFNLGGFKKNTNATITNFTALEESIGIELFGVVGNSPFTKCELVIDYIFKEVTIYRLNKNGMRKKGKWTHMDPSDTLQFFLKGKMPIIQAKAGKHRLMMGLDSGASACVMDENFMEKLNNCFQVFDKTTLTSFGHGRSEVPYSQLNNLRVGKLPCPPMKTLFVSMAHFNQHVKGQQLDGILGYDFLSKFRVAINFRKKEIYLWDGHTVEEQWLAEKSGKSGPLAY